MTGRAEDGADAPTTKDASVRVSHDGHVVATADLTTEVGPPGTAKVSLDTPHADVPSEARGELVDQVLDHPDVRGSADVRVVAPLGDSAALGRLQERTTNYHAHAAGASSIAEADVPQPETDE